MSDTDIPDRRATDVRLALAEDRVKVLRQDVDDHEDYHRTTLGPDRHKANNRISAIELALGRDDEGRLRRIDRMEAKQIAFDRKLEVISVRFMLLWGALVGVVGIVVEMGIRWLITGHV